MSSNNPQTTLVSRPQRHRKPDWRLTVRFRHGAEDDLIEYLRLVSSGRRATIIRQALRLAMQSGLTYNGCFVQGTHRKQADLRTTIRFRHDKHDDLIAYLKSLPSRKRSAFVRQALRAALQMVGAGPEGGG